MGEIIRTWLHYASIVPHKFPYFSLFLSYFYDLSFVPHFCPALFNLEQQ